MTSFRMPQVTKLNVNGSPRTVAADADISLLSVLRDQLDLTGTKYGCGEGQCGACTVLIDGSPRRSCITLVGAVGQKQITTIEGLAQGDKLHPVQEQFIACDGMQCGFCTPGMIMSCVSLLEKNKNPTLADAKQACSGNLCRCGTYPKVFEAVLAAAKQA